MTNLAKPTGRIDNAVAKLLVSIVKQCLAVFEKSHQRLKEDYLSQDAEVPSEVFANFPLLRKRAQYEKNCKQEDKKSFKGI